MDQVGDLFLSVLTFDYLQLSLNSFTNYIPIIFIFPQQNVNSPWAVMLRWLIYLLSLIHI